jgi:hypothetical protein
MYKIVGADQKEYGPVTKEQLQSWIAQGRANATTIVSLDGGPWKQLSTFPELAALLTAAPPPAPAYGQTYVTTQSVGAKANGMAVTGLVLGILGLCCPFISLLSIIFSAIGLSQIQKDPRAYSTTKIVPILGLILGLLGVLAMVVYMMFGNPAELLREIQRQH